ncbi:MAG: hemolysin family protein [Acidobacteriota bacterium]
MNETVNNTVLIDVPTFVVGLIVIVALFLLLSLIAGARSALGDLTAERLAEESGLPDSFDPGSRPYEALKLLRLTLLVIITVLGSAGPAPWCGPVTGSLIGLAGIGLGSFVQIAIAPRNPTQILTASAPLLRLVDLLFGWIIAPLARTHERLYTQHRRTTSELDEEVREEQIEEVIRDAEEEGLLEPEQTELVREIVDAGETVVREVMTPRVDIFGISADSDLVALTDAFVRSRHSRLLVYENTLDKTVGVLALRDLLPQLREGNTTLSARDLMRPVPHVPANKYVLELLRELREQRQQLAVVVDEYGGTAGIVTLEDLIEEIVGDIRDEHELPEEEVRTDGKGGWLVDGLMSVDDVEQATGLEIAADGVETLGGLVFSQLGRIPRVGERVTVAGEIALEVARMQGRRIATVRIVPPAH